MNNKEVKKYFLGNIFEAKCHYTQWKILQYSLSKNIVGEAMAGKYAGIQNVYSNFFGLAKRSSLISFVIMISHVFDTNKDSLSLIKINKVKYDKFFSDNEKIIKDIKKVRHELFAHRKKEVIDMDYKIPSILDLDNFFINLEKFYNELVKEDNTSAMFNNSDQIKHEIEYLYQNLFLGNNFRDKYNEINLLWDNDPKRISNIL